MRPVSKMPPDSLLKNPRGEGTGPAKSVISLEIL
jgi:hypothetical protein